jgi:hypothetical protein
MERKLVLLLMKDGKPNKDVSMVLEHDDEVDLVEAANAAFSKIKKQEPVFVPRLMYADLGDSLGDLGTPSPFKDEEGHELYVGDVVEISRKEGTNDVKHLTFVCLDENGKFFVMGIYDRCNSDAGVIDEKWRVRKVRNHTDVLDGEEHNFAVCVRSSSSTEKNQSPNFCALLAAMLSAVAEKE